MKQKLLNDLARCHDEIERTLNLVMESVDPCGGLLGFHDWNWERRVIEQALSEIP